ncbi:fumarylacetoacetate hydrolase [Lentzea sp. NBRC 105346]|uniref:hypothetical protein n=1 Tax=Lentzea sp. NBRC 105346 TaxID=3032205 RepID=UPI0024A2A80B|nr:hypothetical protein [Lentzea sp. NBRC 105346]GLZ35513.1 fumarylacetoacetate hydrolase [Lentzea sp. NBRC 105346]
MSTALSAQLEQQRAALRRGAWRVGWKVGAGQRERIGDGIVVGHLTSESQLSPGQTYVPRDGEELHADAEIAVTVGPDLAFSPALEIVDLSGTDEAPQIVADNVFHRAFALGAPAEQVADTVRLLVNGEVRASAPIPSDVLDRVTSVGRILESVGERLQEGDLVITGAVVQVPVRRGDVVTADFGALGQVTLTVAAAPS